MLNCIVQGTVDNILLVQFWDRWLISPSIFWCKKFRCFPPENFQRPHCGDSVTAPVTNFTNLIIRELVWPSEALNRGKNLMYKRPPNLLEIPQFSPISEAWMSVLVSHLDGWNPTWYWYGVMTSNWYCFFTGSRRASSLYHCLRSCRWSLRSTTLHLLPSPLTPMCLTHPKPLALRVLHVLAVILAVKVVVFVAEVVICIDVQTRAPSPQGCGTAPLVE